MDTLERSKKYRDLQKKVKAGYADIKGTTGGTIRGVSDVIGVKYTKLYRALNSELKCYINVKSIDSMVEILESMDHWTLNNQQVDLFSGIDLNKPTVKQDNSVVLARIEANIELIRSDIATIYKIVTDNGVKRDHKVKKFVGWA